MKKWLSLMLFGFTLAHAEPLPPQPTMAEHPGSAIYSHSLFHETLSLRGRAVEFYAPADFKTAARKLTVVVFGHGQAIGAGAYQASFEHWAKKGVAVVCSQYDTGFFDQDWARMGADYTALVSDVLAKYQNYLDSRRVIYSGHSKGAYIALMASGLPSTQQIVKPAAIVLFEPAGYDAQFVQRMDPAIPVTLTWADADTVIKESAVREIYDLLPATKKQLIRLISYKGTMPELPADHFFSLSQKLIIGGRDGISPFHYYGTWKWILGAAWDLENGGAVTNSYIYGDQAGSTGLQGPEHAVLRNW